MAFICRKLETNKYKSEFLNIYKKMTEVLRMTLKKDDGEATSAVEQPTSRKRSRIEEDQNLESAKNVLLSLAPNMYFLLEISQYEDTPVYYRAPLYGCESVRKVKKIIEECQEMERAWGEPLASEDFAVRFMNYLEWSKKNPRERAREEKKSPDRFVFDTQKCVSPQTTWPSAPPQLRFDFRTEFGLEEALKWEEVNQNQISSYSQEVTELYQLCKIDGFYDR
jgi:hypothetical protein